MHLSFVIPAHNEEGLIGPTVRALHEAGAAAAPGEYEIIVADDSSTDRTGEIAAELGARVVRLERRQIAAARNAGACAAAGGFLFFIDADTVVPARAVREAVAALQAGAAGGGSPVRFDGRIPLWARMLLPAVLLMFRVFRLTGGCFLFCRRAAFDAAGGFDESLFASEEITMAQSLKAHGRFVIIREPVITSGRKLRTYSGWELLWKSLAIVVRGRRGVQSRERLDVWYGPRREDPEGVRG
jgi:glycosyltransferase involved in cell wall biosynthesis